MPIALTNKFDEGLAPLMVDYLNSLNLYLKVTDSLSVTEGSFTPTWYTLNEDFPHVPVGSWTSATLEGEYYTSATMPVIVLNPDPVNPMVAGGFILTAGEDGTDAYAFFDLEGIEVPVGSALVVGLKIKLSDKLTP